MTELHEALAARVGAWRAAGYVQQAFPAIAEILLYARNEDGSTRYLREAQLRALETYWFLRLMEGTPRIEQLYERLFDHVPDRLDALGLDRPEFKDVALDVGYQGLIERIKTDDAFVREQRLEGLRETLSLTYPSWILALAMGAGKTILVGTIVATEFAMAMEYPEAGEAGQPFIENALVFAPGKTIIESLRELATIHFNEILPPRLHGPFAASLKLTFTRDDERDIPVTRRSSFNLVVTNTEKIAIRARARHLRGGFLQLAARQEEAEAVANLRLQTLASLPHLGVFSDEAHHTYGQSLGAELKRVRQTVDYLAEATNVIAVVNTTGTPYFQRQPLRDVVVWYGLAQGIRDGILKEVAGNIYAYDFDEAQADAFVGEVVTTFLADYGDHALPDGSPARLAIYFPQTDDLAELRPRIELAAMQAGLDPTAILANTNESTAAEIDAFNRLNDPSSPHRIILLVNKGTEGWNCPSLFATALARRLRTSNNFVLQAASRCLRQVPGNDRPARIYLSSANRSILDRQLQETYGETLADLDARHRESKRAVIRIRKTELPRMALNRPRHSLERQATALATLTFTRPTPDTPTLSRSIFSLGLSAVSRRVLQQAGDAIKLEIASDAVDAHTAASRLASAYRVDDWAVLDGLRLAYGDAEIEIADLDALARQLENQLGLYEASTDDEAVELEVLKPHGFDLAEGGAREAEISYPADHEHLVFGPERIAENPSDYGFHYIPYNFDSGPEADFFEKVVRALNVPPDQVRDVYFTGAVSDPRKTDLAFEYTVDGRSHWYTPDFAIHTIDDRWLLVEVKMPARRQDPIEGERGLKAQTMRELQARNPGRITYRMVFAGDFVSPADITAVTDFARP